MSSRHVWSTWLWPYRTIGTVGAIAFPLWMGMTGCAPVSPAVSAPPSVENALIGKTKQELIACTGITPDERTVGDVTELMFYKEASLLEESFPVSKSSFPRVHHGCLAHLQLKEGRVEGIHYHAVPPSYQGYDHCDALFDACLAH